MATARDLVEAALREIGVLAEGETATASQAAETLARLNRYIDRLKTERLTIYSITRSTWNITANVDTYAVGTGQTVNIERPIFVEDVHFQDTSVSPPTPEYPLERMTEQGRAALILKLLPSTQPQAWYYNPTFPYGALTLWPVPNTSIYQGVIYAWTAVGTLATLNTAVSLPPGYEEMLITNLAMVMCPAYDRQPNPVLVEAARESKAAIKRANGRLMDMTFERGALIQTSMGWYDIRQN